MHKMLLRYARLMEIEFVAVIVEYALQVLRALSITRFSPKTSVYVQVSCRLSPLSRLPTLVTTIRSLNLRINATLWKRAFPQKMCFA